VTARTTSRSSFTRTNRYDLSTTFTYPVQATTTTFQAKVRVTSNAQTVTGTYPVRVFADVPADPNTASDRQLQVMRSVAVDDGLWYLHNQLTRSGNEEDALTGAQATGYINQADNTIRNAATAGFLWSLSLNGHYAAFPSAYIGAIPDPADNTARWANDPYAEDAMRVVNGLLLQATIVGVDAASEANLTGFYPEVQQEPIYGTDDGIGIWIGYNAGEQTIYPMGHAVSAFSVAHLGGFVAQVGDANRILGRRFEFVLQQMVDAVVWAQNESGVLGSWYYTPNSASDDLSTSAVGHDRPVARRRVRRDQGVIVPNIVKARLMQYISANSNTCATGIRHRRQLHTTAGTTCDFTLSAAHVLALGWVGSQPVRRRRHPAGVPQLQRRSPAAAARALQHQPAVREHQLPAHLGGPEQLEHRLRRGRQLRARRRPRQPLRHAALAGRRPRGRARGRQLRRQQLVAGVLALPDQQPGRERLWNWVFSTLQPNSDNSGGAWLRAVWAILVLSPDAIPPLAIGTSNVATAPEGTAIAFNGAASDPGTGNPVYTWDVRQRPPARARTSAYAYPDNGAFNVTLTSTSIGGTSVDTLPVTITNVAPTASVGAGQGHQRGQRAGVRTSTSPTRARRTPTRSPGPSATPRREPRPRATPTPTTARSTSPRR
jgi:hypothetical protein